MRDASGNYLYDVAALRVRSGPPYQVFEHLGGGRLPLLVRRRGDQAVSDPAEYEANVLYEVTGKMRTGPVLGLRPGEGNNLVSRAGERDGFTWEHYIKVSRQRRLPERKK